MAKKVETDYETFSVVPTNPDLSVATRLNPTETREFAYGASAPSTVLVRKTDYTYLHNNSTNGSTYVNLNIVDRVASRTVFDGSNTQVSRTVNEYDKYTAGITSSSAIQHSSSFSTSYLTRGNLTALSRWRNTDGAMLLTRRQYDDAGNILSVTDPNSNTTHYDYTDNWTTQTGGSTCAPSSGQTKAYLTKITNALNQITKYSFYSCTGLEGTITDPNGNQTSATYDSLGRSLVVTFPDGGQSSNSYDDANLIVTSGRLMQSGKSIFTVARYDQLGRDIEQELCEDGTANCSSPIATVFAYDGKNRLISQTNPCRPTADSTCGTTQFQYDAIDRQTLLIPPDGSVTANNVKTEFCNNATLVIDEAGKLRRSISDALGRLIEVDEPNSPTATVGACPASGDPILVTTYGYDALGNLTSVVQNGSRNRGFAYDSLSRLTSATNPESGTITYTYDANGNALTRVSPAPNQTGAATVTTTYKYDALNRLTEKSYSDGTTPTADFFYDVSSTNGVNISNPVGRLVRAFGNNCTQTINSYDPMGRVTTQWIATPNYCSFSFVPTYAYNLLGGLTSYANGLGVSFTQTFDSAGRASSLTSSLSDSQHPGTLLTVDPTSGYFPSGALGKAKFGNGLTQTDMYNNRLQPCRLNVNSSGTSLVACTGAVPGGNLLDLTYGFNAGTSDNGNVASMTGTGQQAFSRTYTYDGLNRLATMADSNTGQTCKGLSWTYDAWGNRTDQSVTAGACGAFHATVGTNNRLSGAPYQYDAAGNMTHDASHSYTYDAENRLISVDGGSTATYVYDALGVRASRHTSSTTTDYIHDPAGHIIFDWVPTGNMVGFASTEYVYFNGALLAEYTNSTTHFVHTDHLGSTRLLTGVNQSIVQNLDYLPFGELNSTDSGITTHKFTAKERDSESGLDNFVKRYIGSSLGRFMTPDAFYKDSHVGDPQSWNEYAYARNNPLRYVDPTGQNATVSTSCSTDANNATTCNVNISASFSIYAQQGSNLTQDQLNQAASTIQSSIQNAWSGSFTQDGVTYNVSTQVSVSVAESQDAAMSSGAQNVIGISNGNASATADSFVNPKSLLTAITGGPDTGVWNIDNLGNGVAAHEFTHLLGVDDKSGAVLSNTNLLNDPNIPHTATSRDFSWGIKEASSSVGLGLSMKNWYNGPALPTPFRFSTTDTVGAPVGWWK
jgi:RHS repeat-associated protein